MEKEKIKKEKIKMEKEKKNQKSKEDDSEDFEISFEESNEYDEIVSEIFFEGFKKYFFDYPNEKKFELLKLYFIDPEKYHEKKSKLLREAYNYGIDYYFFEHPDWYGLPSQRSGTLFAEKVRKNYDELNEEFQKRLYDFILSDTEYSKKFVEFYQKHRDDIEKSVERHLQYHLKELEKEGYPVEEIKKRLPKEFCKC